MHIHEFNSIDHLNDYLCSAISSHLHAALHVHDFAYLVVPGGRTPVALFEKLSHTSLVWPKIKVTLTDERMVDANSEESNEHLVKNSLIKAEARDAQFISLYDHTSSLDQNLLDVDARIKGLPTFDVVILGMGEDGHTASLFPGSEGLKNGLAHNCQEAVIYLKPISASHMRISLTRARLGNTKNIYLYIRGEKKKATLEKALYGSDYYEMPIRAFLFDETLNIKVLYTPD